MPGVGSSALEEEAGSSTLEEAAGTHNVAAVIGYSEPRLEADSKLLVADLRGLPREEAGRHIAAAGAGIDTLEQQDIV